jgi:hypothetical protein
MSKYNACCVWGALRPNGKRTTKKTSILSRTCQDTSERTLPLHVVWPMGLRSGCVCVTVEHAAFFSIFSRCSNSSANSHPRVAHGRVVRRSGRCKRGKFSVRVTTDPHRPLRAPPGQPPLTMVLQRTHTRGSDSTEHTEQIQAGESSLVNQFCSVLFCSSQLRSSQTTRGDRSSPKQYVVT